MTLIQNKKIIGLILALAIFTTTGFTALAFEYHNRKLIYQHYVDDCQNLKNEVEKSGFTDIKVECEVESGPVGIWNFATKKEDKSNTLQKSELNQRIAKLKDKESVESDDQKNNSITYQKSADDLTKNGTALNSGNQTQESTPEKNKSSQPKSDSASKEQENAKSENNTINDVSVAGGKDFSLKDYHDMLDQIVFENTTDQINYPPITGNAGADQYIRELAKKRGYRLWPMALEDKLVDTDGENKLQVPAASAWKDMKEAALREGINLNLVSGYRSVEQQSNLFNGRFENIAVSLTSTGFYPEEIIAGAADQTIGNLLQTTAPAGFSRHHTGYTVDVSDATPDNTTKVFFGSKAYKWMSANNYLNARKYGFIPSYPEGGRDFGPNPEPWEFVWVGRQRLGFDS